MRPRWSKEYEAVDLAEVPHRRLSAPVRVFEYFFEGARRGRGRENILKLPITASGTVTAIAFWFDLHLDDVESITTGAQPVLCQVPAQRATRLIA